MFVRNKGHSPKYLNPCLVQDREMKHIYDVIQIPYTHAGQENVCVNISREHSVSILIAILTNVYDKDICLMITLRTLKRVYAHS